MGEYIQAFFIVVTMSIVVFGVIGGFVFFWSHDSFTQMS